VAAMKPGYFNRELQLAMADIESARRRLEALVMEEPRLEQAIGMCRTLVGAIDQERGARPSRRPVSPKAAAALATIAALGGQKR
jgi:hypothetical protein